MYERLCSILDEHHVELSRTNVKIALAWALAWKQDVDGRLVLGKCKKASELDRELHRFDFVILLNRDFWQNPRVSDAQRMALLDHELCHCGISCDERGDPKRDERGRFVYRIVKHSIEEFTEVIQRHGVYKADLETFAMALQRAEQKTQGDQWIGYSRLHEALKTVGVAIDVDVIASWPDHARRDVLEWAELRRDDGVRTVNAALSEFIPPCLAEALGMTTQPGGDGATQH